MTAAGTTGAEGLLGGHSDTDTGKRAVYYAMFLALVAAVGPTNFGYALGFTSPAIYPMEVSASQHVFNSETADAGGVKSTDASNFGSLLNVGCMIGALLSAPCSDILGRKWTITLAAIPWGLAWVWIADRSSVAELIVARILSGVATGIASAAVPTFLNEMAPTSIRGAIGAVNQLAVTFGIWLVYFIGFMLEKDDQVTVFTCTTQDDCTDIVEEWSCDMHINPPTCVGPLSNWRTLAWVASVICGVMFVTALTILPETPTFLASKGKVAAARKTLLALRETVEEAERDLADLQPMSINNDGKLSSTDGEIVAPAKQSAMEQLRALFRPGARKPFGIGCALMVAQQFSGINAVIFFSSDILVEAGMDNTSQGVVIIGSVQFIATALSVFLMDRAGRRVLLLTSLAVMVGSALLMSIFFFNDKKPSILALIALMLYITGFSIGLGPIPWLIMGEIFPAHIRSAASAIATVINWTCAFIITESFQSAADGLTPQGVFIVFAVICTCFFVFVFKFVPETRGKTFEEIAALF